MKALSFVDDVAWWAEGRDELEVATELEQAAAAAIAGAASNGVAFDHDKPDAILLSRPLRRGKIKVTGSETSTKEATKWLDSRLTLKEHHPTRLKQGRNAMSHLRWLTGQMGQSLANCRKAMTACVQSVAMFGAELWWKGEGVRGMAGRAEDLQKIVNQEVRAVTGAFRTTNLGALAMESGLMPAGCPAGEPTAAVWAEITQPASGRPSLRGRRRCIGYREAPGVCT